MKRVIVFITVFLVPFFLRAQTVSVYMVVGDVTVKTADGKVHQAGLDELLKKTDIVRTGTESSVSLYSSKAGGVITYGSDTEIPVSEVGNQKTGFAKRVIRMLKPDNNGRYVTYKGTRYQKADNLEFKLINQKTGDEVNRLNVGDVVYFRIENKEDVPVFVAVYWKDADGELHDCLETSERFCIVPEKAKISTWDMPIEVDSPCGIEDLYLAASYTPFTMEDYLNAGTGVVVRGRELQTMEYSSPSIEVAYSGAEKLTVYINGKEVPVSVMKGLKNSMRRVRIGGLPQDERDECSVRMFFADRDGSVIEEKTFNLRYVDSRKDLHLLAVGVGGEMVDRTFAPLVYPKYDAREVRNCIVRYSGSYYNLKSQMLLYTGRETGKKEILEELRRLADIAGPGDVVMIYFSGHGAEVDGEYYFIANDTRASDLYGTAISGAALRECLDKITAKDAIIFVFVDTCHSEALFKGKADGQDGIVYYASSQTDQFSEESAAWKNSAYAMAFVSAFSGTDGSAFASDGLITIKGLQNYLVQKVEKETSNNQTPTWFDTGLGNTYPIFRVGVSGSEIRAFQPVKPASPDYRVRVVNPDKNFEFRWNPEGIRRLRLTLQDRNNNIILRREFTYEDHFGFSAAQGLSYGNVGWTMSVEYEDGTEARGSGMITFIKSN